MDDVDVTAERSITELLLALFFFTSYNADILIYLSKMYIFCYENKYMFFSLSFLSWIYNQKICKNVISQVLIIIWQDDVWSESWVGEEEGKAASYQGRKGKT